jgi:hypothetical protein
VISISAYLDSRSRLANVGLYGLATLSRDLIRGGGGGVGIGRLVGSG